MKNDTSDLRAEVAPGIHRSRWGYHPCDYPTFRNLKRLSRAYWSALCAYRVWLRWKRKAPHNRVLRRTIRDASGRKVGVEVLGPRPEPPLCPHFTRRAMATVSFHEGKHYPDGVLVERVTFDDHGVPAALAACYPAPSVDKVSPLSLTTEQIVALAAALGD